MTATSGPVAPGPDTPGHTTPGHTTPGPTTPGPAARRKRHTWVIVLISVLAVVVLVPVGAGAAFLWSFSGGWDGIRPEAQATDRRVVEAREESDTPLRDEHEATVAAVLQATGGTALETAHIDQCSEGQNNWKIHDGYTLSCTRTAATAIQLPPMAGSMPEAARTIETRLLARGWTLQNYAGPPAHSLVPATGDDEGKARYAGTDHVGVLKVGIGVQSYPPLYLPGADEGSSAAAVEDAFASGSGVRVMVVNEVTYFED